MKTILKYPFYDDAWIVALLMPKGAQILSVGVQGNAPCLWALVDDAAPPKERRFAVVGTGKDCGYGGVLGDLEASAGLFIGTYQRSGGAIVGHVFDLGER